MAKPQTEKEAKALLPTVAHLKERGQKILSTVTLLRVELSKHGGPSPEALDALTTLKSVGEQLVDEGENAANITSHLHSTAAPIVSSLYPTSGPAIGNTNITIKGSGLTHVQSVLFGETAASDLVLKSDSEISVKSPPGKPGASADVSVVTPKGTSTIVPGNAFSYTG